jgi:cysteine desulfurase
MITVGGISTDQVIYLDHQATTPVDPRVLDVMLPYLTSSYGNPSSLHAYGRQAAEAIRVARNQLGELIGASAESEVVFTSGATEADCLAITGIARAFQGVGLHIITTAIEHKAVLGSCQYLAEEASK